MQIWQVTRPTKSEGKNAIGFWLYKSYSFESLHGFAVLSLHYIDFILIHIID